MKVRKSRRSVKLRPIRGKTGIEMMKDLGYEKSEFMRGYDTRFVRNGSRYSEYSEIVIINRCVRFLANGEPTEAKYCEILALARMIEDGEL